MSACFRQRVIAFFLQRKLLNERLAKSMVQWIHSGFSVDEGGTDTVVYRAPYSDYFRTDSKIFSAIAFLADVLQHLPDTRTRLIRAYALVLLSNPGHVGWHPLPPAPCPRRLETQP